MGVRADNRWRKAGNAMRIMRLGIVLALLLGAATLWSQPAPQTASALSNDDIIRMVKGGLEENPVLSAIAASDTQFDVSVNGLLALKQAGVGDKIIDAMLAAAAKKRATPSTPEPSETTPTAEARMTQNLAQMGISPQMMAQMPPAARQQMMVAMRQLGSMGGMAGMLDGLLRPDAGMPMLSPAAMPKVSLLLATGNKAMASSFAQMAESKMKGMPGGGAGAGSLLSSLATQGLSFAAIGGGGMFAGPALGIATGMFGGFGHHGMPKLTYIWALPGHNSGHALETVTPQFELQFGDIVGLDPDGYEPVLVHLVQTKDNWRLVGATKSKLDSMGAGAPQSMIDEQRTPVHTTRLARGHLEIQAATPLAAGEYGLVLRPTKVNKPKKGESQSEAEQGVFYLVWEFSIQGTAHR